MSRTRNTLMLVAAVAAGLILSTGVALAAVVLGSGVVMVKVHDKSPDGIHLTAPVPAALVDLGLALVPLAPIAADLGAVRSEIEPWGPALEALADELARCPDATLVEVEDRGERVRVSKRGGKLRVEVESRDADVQVSVPVRLVVRALKLLST